ncbi:MAG: carboxypeptidase-like regulatory domain-containing protein, partial [Acidobacteriota bacterium]|nr:carboxypeptidase-like regulatory domain-containing protein [Acidobacteriota bacterium]
MRYLSIALLIAAITSAQETINFSSVSGRVTDPSGAVVENAQISARQIDTNLVSTTRSDSEGRFRFPYLKVGPYEIKVRQPGFADALRSIALSVGGAFDLPVVLAVESALSNVIVHSEAPVVETARSQIAGTITQTEVQNLPLNGRNFLDLALLVPGVSPTNTAS